MVSYLRLQWKLLLHWCLSKVFVICVLNGYWLFRINLVSRSLLMFYISGMSSLGKVLASFLYTIMSFTHKGICLVPFQFVYTCTLSVALSLYLRLQALDWIDKERMKSFYLLLMSVGLLWFSLNLIWHWLYAYCKLSLMLRYVPVSVISLDVFIMTGY